MLPADELQSIARTSKVEQIKIEWKAEIDEIWRKLNDDATGPREGYVDVLIDERTYAVCLSEREEHPLLWYLRGLGYTVEIGYPVQSNRVRQIRISY